MECFVEVYRGGGLKVNAGKSKVIVLGGEDGLDYEVCVDWILLENVSKFKKLGCVLDESGTDETECSRKLASGRRVAGAIRSLVNARSCECARVLHKSLLVPLLMFGSETMIWKEEVRSRIRAVQMDNLRSLIGIRKRIKSRI